MQLMWQVRSERGGKILFSMLEKKIFFLAVTCLNFKRCCFMNAKFSHTSVANSL